MKKFIIRGLLCNNPIKLSLKMRLTVLLLIVSLFKINASTYSQNTKITLELRQVTVLDVLNSIEEKSEFKFFYSNLDFDLDRKFTVSVKSEKIHNILDKLFANTNISHDVVDRQIVLFPEEEDSTSNNVIVEEEEDQEIEITGVVTDSQGQPLPGVNIIIEGTFTGTGTDFDGNYAISASAGDVLVFSFIGMSTQKITVGEQTKIDVVLEEDASTLDEVVVTALGIKKEKKALGYGSSTIQSADIVEAGPANFATALYGKAAGVQIATTPGGSTSATNITIRGINSITGRSQPLIILDGVPIRDEEVSNTSYWSSQRIRGNGLLDINPEDIDNISILKGASAAALYGSEAVNGVILITTKSGKEGTTGMSVDVSSSYSVDKMAYWVDYQNERGQGYPIFINNAGQDSDGFITYDAARGGGRGLIGTSLNFGPWFDGQPITAWDGITRPYESQGNNFGGIFQDAHNTTQHVAISNVAEKSNTRFSVTRADNKGISIGARDEKNTLNLNTTFKIAENFTTNVKVNYINQTVTNRPYKIDRMVNNFGGMMGRFDHGDWYFPRVFNSDGYRYRTGTQQSTRPEENIVHNGMNGSLMNYVWRLKAMNNVEKMDRVIGIITQDWAITDNLNLRGRVSTDFTTRITTNSVKNWRPLAFGTSGAFSMSNYQNKILYGDLLLTYTRELNPDLNLSILAGYNATKQNGTVLSRNTSGGLSVENWFDIAASNNTPGSGSSRNAISKDAFLATVGFEYKDFLFLEGTVRRDRTSTMHPDQNDFVYPSVNSSFVFSDAWELPDFVTYAKLRGSWGIVGNYPDPFRANIAYNQNTLGSQGGATPVYTTVSNAMGNDAIRPEEKHEYEFGLETKLFNGKVGLEASYYNAKVVDQILPLTLPISSGGSSVLTNIGTLRNSGVEFMLNVTPVDTGDFRWDAVLNLAKNSNKIEQLAPGLDEIQHANWDGSAAKMISEVGQSMGDIYAHPIATHENGGQIVDPNGLYKMDGSEWVKYGNAMPKLIGGMMNTFSYKNITFDAVLDFRHGGHIMPTGINWMTSRGITKKSLNFSTTERGGLSYYINDEGTKVGTDASSTSGPGGQKVYHDGMLLDGVKLDGSPNDVIVSQANYYWEVYNWGGPQYSPNTNYGLYIKENNYVKVREMSLGYKFPKKILDKIGIDRLQLSVYGRNLFYIYRSIDDLDVEATTAGSRWNQNINNAGNSPASRTFGVMLRASL